MMIKHNKKIKTEFGTLLKKKFFEKTDEFGFLDPFTNEFNYAARTVTFSGEAKEHELATGVIQSIRELAVD